MNAELLQGMIDVVFKGNMVILAPCIFLLMVILFADRLIDLIYSSIGNSSRRNKY